MSPLQVVQAVFVFLRRAVLVNTYLDRFRHGDVFNMVIISTG
jgi:hypothetical protein